MATHARIKFTQDSVIKIVSIDKIKELKKKFPKDLTDFNKKQLYTSFWSDDKNPKEVELSVQIADLHGKSILL